MIKPALLMGAAMAGISAGTYYGLQSLPPGLIPPPMGRVAPAAEVAQSAPAPAPIVVAAAPTPAAPASDATEAAPEPAAVEAIVEPAAPAPAPDPGPAPAPAEPPKAIEARAAEPAPAPVPTETAKAEPPAPAARAIQEADAIKPWWPDPSTMPATQLKLQYAGQVQGQNAIALLFSSALKLDTLQQHATVRAANGEAVAASWTLGKNPKLAVLGGLAPGRYTVILQPQVADEQGYMLGATLTGPVYVKE